MEPLLILNFEGENGATTWTEEAQGLSPYDVGNCQIDTSHPLVGTSSLKMLLMANDPGYLRYLVETLNPAKFSLSLKFMLDDVPEIDDTIDFRLSKIGDPYNSPFLFMRLVGPSTLTLQASPKQPLTGAVYYNDDFTVIPDHVYTLLVECTQVDDTATVTFSIDGSPMASGSITTESVGDLAFEGINGFRADHASAYAQASLWIDAVDLESDPVIQPTIFIPKIMVM